MVLRMLLEFPLVGPVSAAAPFLMQCSLRKGERGIHTYYRSEALFPMLLGRLQSMNCSANGQKAGSTLSELRNARCWLSTQDFVASLDGGGKAGGPRLSQPLVP
jgi:hypothetical protein